MCVNMSQVHITAMTSLAPEALDSVSLWYNLCHIRNLEVGHVD